MSTCQSLLAACQISTKSDRPRERHARAFDCSFVSPDRAMVDVDVARDGAAAHANSEASSSSSSSGGEEAVVVVDMASSLPSVLRGCACADGGRLLHDACHGAARGLAAWTRRGGAARALLVASVGSVALAALTVLLAAAFVLVAAATSAAAVAAVVSLAALSALLAVAYVGALSVAVFVVAATTAATVVAITSATVGNYDVSFEIANGEPSRNSS
uniref:Uncharacterized protein n=1 Tax=Oryza meridionalis TaxID=40149 RepID=A0A0E0ERX2_9ORYZ